MIISKLYISLIISDKGNHVVTWKKMWKLELRNNYVTIDTVSEEIKKFKTSGFLLDFSISSLIVLMITRLSLSSGFCNLVLFLSFAMNMHTRDERQLSKFAPQTVIPDYIQCVLWKLYFLCRTTLSTHLYTTVIISEENSRFIAENCRVLFSTAYNFAVTQ